MYVNTSNLSPQQQSMLIQMLQRQGIPISPAGPGVAVKGRKLKFRLTRRKVKIFCILLGILLTIIVMALVAIALAIYLTLTMTCKQVKKTEEFTESFEAADVNSIILNLPLVRDSWATIERKTTNLSYVDIVVKRIAVRESVLESFEETFTGPTNGVLTAAFKYTASLKSSFEFLIACPRYNITLRIPEGMNLSSIQMGASNIQFSYNVSNLEATSLSMTSFSGSVLVSNVTLDSLIATTQTGAITVKSSSFSSALTLDNKVGAIKLSTVTAGEATISSKGFGAITILSATFDSAIINSYQGDIKTDMAIMSTPDGILKATTGIGSIQIDRFYVGSTDLTAGAGAATVEAPLSYNGTISLTTANGKAKIQGFTEDDYHLETNTEKQKIGSIPLNGTASSILMSSTTGDVTLKTCSTDTCGF